MPDVSVVTDRREVIDQSLTSLGLWVKEQCPEASVEISLVRYEDEDAHLRVTPPHSFSEEMKEDLGNRLADRAIDILLDSGICILTAVLDPDAAS